MEHVEEVHPTEQPNFAALTYVAGQVFTPGAPVNERELFSGRGKQINTILNTISQRGFHAVLYGERGVGKTSLANVLSAFLLETGKSFLLPRINCDASDTFSSVWKRQFQDIVITETKQQMGFGTSAVQENRAIVDCLPAELTPDDVRRTLERLARGIVLVPIFDEFDRLTDRTISTLMADTVKALSDYSVLATIILIGVADSVDELIGEHQSIERALVQIPMPRMSLQEAASIVTKGLERIKMSISQGALDEITSLAQGLPYIVHMLALHSTQTTIERKNLKVEIGDVEAGIKRALGQWQQSIKSSYYEATKSQQPGHLYKEVLLACALAEDDDLGYFSAAGVRGPLRAITGRKYDIPNFARHLKELSQPGRGDMLFRTGPKRKLRYRFNSPLMRPYIVMRGVSEELISKENMRKLMGG